MDRFAGVATRYSWSATKDVHMIEFVVTLLRILLIQVTGHTGIALPLVAAFLLIRLLVGGRRSARR